MAKSGEKKLASYASRILAKKHSCSPRKIDMGNSGRKDLDQYTGSQGRPLLGPRGSRVTKKSCKGTGPPNLITRDRNKCFFTPKMIKND